MLFYLNQWGYFFAAFCYEVIFGSLSAGWLWRLWTNFDETFWWCGTSNSWLDFVSDPDHSLDSGILEGILSLQAIQVNFFIDNSGKWAANSYEGQEVILASSHSVLMLIQIQVQESLPLKDTASCKNFVGPAALVEFCSLRLLLVTCRRLFVYDAINHGDIVSSRAFYLKELTNYQ